MAADTETMLWPLTSRKKAWLEFSCRRLLAERWQMQSEQRRWRGNEEPFQKHTDFAALPQWTPHYFVYSHNTTASKQGSPCDFKLWATVPQLKEAQWEWSDLWGRPKRRVTIVNVGGDEAADQNGNGAGWERGRDNLYCEDGSTKIYY